MDIYNENKKHVDNLFYNEHRSNYITSSDLYQETPRYITLVYKGYSESNLW